jgi:hypothetical protein
MTTVSASRRPSLSVPNVLSLAVAILLFAVAGATVGAQPWNPVLTLLVIAFAIPSLIALSSFIRGFYIYLFILPFSYFLKRLLFLSPGVTQTEWFIATALPDIVLVCALCNLILDKRHRFPRSAANLPVLLFLVWSILEVFNPNISVTIGISGFKKTAFYVAMYYLAAAVSLRDDQVVDKVARITILCAIVAAGYGFVQSIFGLAPFEIATIDSGLTNMTVDSIDVLYAQGILRAFSTFSGPWILGDYLAIGFMFNVFAYLRGKVGRGKFFLIALWLGLGIFVSLSRSSYLMLMLALALLYMLAAKSQRSLVWRLVLVSLLAGLFVLALSLLWNLVPGGMPTAIFAMYNLFSRIDQWQSLLSYPATFSLIGMGIGSVQASFYFGETIVAETHSFLLTLVSELGVIGVGLFVWALFVLVRDVVSRIARVGAGVDRSSIGVVLSILAGMVIAKSASGGLWGTTMHDNYLWLLSGLLAALSSAHLPASPDGGLKKK